VIPLEGYIGIAVALAVAIFIGIRKANKRGWIKIGMARQRAKEAEGDAEKRGKVRRTLARWRNRKQLDDAAYKLLHPDE
jgi:hypothetical protein